MFPRSILPSFFASSVTVLLAFVIGCGSSHTSVAPNSPPNPAPTPSPSPSPAFSVTSINPASGATQVATNATIQITFSSAANASTVNTSTIQLTSPKPVAGAVTYNSSTNTATFTPSAALANNSTYTVTVSGVTSSSGMALTSVFTSTFATVSASGGGGAALQYQVSLLNSQGAYAVHGQISIDTTGMVTVQLTGATANTAYTVQFCPAISPLDSKDSSLSCFNTGTVTTNASGAASSSFKFPRTGGWAGDFTLMTGGNSAYGTYLDGSSTPASGQIYMSTLQPESTVNGVGISTSPQQDPLTSGAVSYSSTNREVTFTVKGGLANTEYTTSESETYYLDGSGSYALNNFTTDASGNGSTTTPLDGIGGDIFQVGPYTDTTPTYAGYIGGFSVPK